MRVNIKRFIEKPYHCPTAQMLSKYSCKVWWRFECTGSGSKTWRFLSYNKTKRILSFYVNLLLKLSLPQSILISQHIPASGGLLTKAWRNRLVFSGVLIEGSFPGGFLFAANAVSLKFLTHNSTVLRLGTLSFRWILKRRRNIRWVTTTESFFRNTSP